MLQSCKAKTLTSPLSSRGSAKQTKSSAISSIDAEECMGCSLRTTRRLKRVTTELKKLAQGLPRSATEQASASS